MLAFYKDYETDEPEDLHTLIQDAPAIEIRQQLLNDPWSVERHNENGLLPFHLIVQRDGDDVNGLIDLFLSYNADINGKTAIEGDTPLHVLIKNIPAERAMPTVKKLLNCGADPKMKNKGLRTAHDYARQKGHRELIEVLTSKKWHMEPDAIITAITKGTVDDVIKVIRLGADVNMKKENGNSPIHYAIKKRHNQDKGAIIDILLEYKANINSQNAEKDTALHLAIKTMPEDNELCVLVEYLLHMKCDPTIKNKWDDTALDIATAKRYEDVIGLLGGRVVPDIKAMFFDCVSKYDVRGMCEILGHEQNAARMFNDVGLHPLHVIALQDSHENHVDMIDALVNAGADVECQTLKLNSTPLHLAATRDNTEVINRLLYHGANPDRRDEKGKTPYELAADREYVRSMDVLEGYFEERAEAEGRKRPRRIEHNDPYAQSRLKDEEEEEEEDDDITEKKSKSCTIL